jgi:hypothetical protein
MIHIHTDIHTCIHVQERRALFSAGAGKTAVVKVEDSGHVDAKEKDPHHQKHAHSKARLISMYLHMRIYIYMYTYI